MTNFPALALLKDGQAVPRHSLPSLLAGAWAEKDIPALALSSLLGAAPHQFARLLARCWMRETDERFPDLLWEALGHSLAIRTSPGTYNGTAHENDLIGRWISSASSHRRGVRAIIGWGSTFHFHLDQRCCFPDSPLVQTPVVILGAGPSGMLAARALCDVGFRQVSVIDQQGRYGGIWNRPEIQMARANPFALHYHGPGRKVILPKAPGSGKAISDFLMRLVHGPASQPLPTVHRAEIKAVIPGDLEHTILLHDEQGERLIQTPLLVNGLGVGEPLSLSSPRFMLTDAAEHVDSRWQEPLTSHRLPSLQGTRLVFVSVSNSTLTMLQEVQALIDQGYDLSYTVLTHHPTERLAYPETTGLYRDLHGGLLTPLAGDLPNVRRAFERARDAHSEREQLLANVTFWTARTDEDGRRGLLVQCRGGQSLTLANMGHLYALTGYGHTASFLGRMGVTMTGERAPLDMDGEVQTAGNRHRRVYRGYFALGPVAVGQPNGAILPGILYRVGEMLPTLLCRAAEYSTTR